MDIFIRRRERFVVVGNFGFRKNSVGVISEEEEGRNRTWPRDGDLSGFLVFLRGGARQSRALITGLVPRFIARARCSRYILEPGGARKWNDLA